MRPTTGAATATAMGPISQLMNCELPLIWRIEAIADLKQVHEPSPALGKVNWNTAPRGSFHPKLPSVGIDDGPPDRESHYG
jgi:hypothetical protein